MLKTPSVRGMAIIIEVKTAKQFSDMDKRCEDALRQIMEREYPAQLRREGYSNIVCYGVCFYRKECMGKKL